MSVTIGSLSADLTLNTARFNSDIRKAKKSGRSLEVKLKGNFRAVRNSVNGAVPGFGKLAAAIAVVAGPVALGALIKSSLDSVDALAKQSDALGIATERLAGYQLAGELTGVAAGGIDKAMKKMLRSVGDANDGLSTQLRAFDQLGLNIEHFKTLNAADQFEQIADRINGLSTQAQKAAVSSAIFGREGVSLLNTFKLGSKGLQEITEEAKAYGTAVTRFDAAKIEQANDAITKAKAASKGFGNSLTVAVAPVLTAVVSEFTRLSAESNGFKNQIDSSGRFIVKAIGFVADAVRGLQVVYLGLRQIVAEVLNAQIQQIRDVANGLAGLINKFSALTGIDVEFTFLNDLADSIRHTTDGLAEQLAQAVNKPMPSEAIDKFFDHAIERSNELAAIAAEGNESGNSIGLFNDAQLEKLTAQQKQREDFEKRHQKQLTDIANKGAYQRFQFEKMNATQKTQFVTGQLVQMTQGVAQENKKLFELNKKAALANALVSTYQGAAKALEWGFPLGPIFAAVVIASGLAQMQAIRSASFGGGGGAPSLAGQGGGGSTVNTIPLAPQESEFSDSSSGGSGAPSSSVQIIINGAVDERMVNEVIIPSIRDASENRDVSILGPNSRDRLDIVEEARAGI